MIDLTCRSLPNTVNVGGEDFFINTDFRVWMRFEIAVSQMQEDDLIDVSYLFKGDPPPYCDIRELLAFSRPREELPRQIRHQDAITLDYQLDADYIYAAFMSQYGIDLLNVEELHWYKFLAMFKGLKDDEVICKIMSYRCYEKNDGKRDIYSDLRHMWQIDRSTPEDQKEIDKFNSYFE